MNDEVNYKNNPLHGLGLKALLTELVDQYGFGLLHAYLNINCFKVNPSIESSVKFLKKTQWAREKVEVFYLYEYKNLPRASSEQFALPPRDRIIPDGQVPGEPATLSFEDAARLQEKRERKAAERDREKGSPRRPSNKSYGKDRDAIYGGARGSQGVSKSRDEAASTNNNESTSNNESTTNNNSTGANDPWAKWRE
jgi:uncharacterized protein (DUF2132 family)